jgi:hypothetical protein
MCRGVGPAASIVVRVGVKVQVSGGTTGLKNTRITKRTQYLSWFGLIDALHLAADDPYTQNHSKSGVTTECRERFGRGLA